MDSKKVRSYYNSYSENYDKFYGDIQSLKYTHLLATGIELDHPLILDLGSGTGLLSIKLATQTLALDISYQMLFEGINAGRSFLPIAADMVKLPIRDKSISLTLSFTAIQNSENPQQAISEIIRIGEKDSKAVVSILKKSKLLSIIKSDIEILGVPHESYDLPPEDLAFILQL